MKPSHTARNKFDYLAISGRLRLVCRKKIVWVLTDHINPYSMLYNLAIKCGALWRYIPGVDSGFDDVYNLSFDQMEWLKSESIKNIARNIQTK